VKIGVAGLWHLGSVTAACLADMGFDVTGWDPDSAVVKKLSTGKAPLFEPGLDELLTKGIQAKRLRFTDSPKPAVDATDFLWVTFDTPVDAQDQADDTWVKRQIKILAPHLKPGAGIIISSQLPVGSCAELEGANPICYSPENLRLGQAINIFQEPDRLVAGIRRPEDRALFEPLFKAITARIEWMGTESAEMTKHAINSFLAASVVFVNELARLCESAGADAREVERGLKSESRIGPKAYVKPGAAFAGGTLARDVRFLTALSAKHGHPSLLLNSILESNRRHQSWAREKLEGCLNPLKGRRVAILGLTYKEGTDTLRRSWAVELALWLHQQGVHVSAYDWQLRQLPGELASVLTLQGDREAALSGSDALVIGTDHPGLQQIQASEMQLLKNPLIIDPNGALNGPLISSLAPLHYCSVAYSVRRSAS
jgi:UDPglucose 6-dehydrogenase